MMELWFLAIAIGVLSLAIIYATFVESKRLDALEKFCKDIKTEVDAVPARFTNMESARRELTAKYNELTNFNAQVAPVIDKLKKEFDVMQVRQHTMEKNIRGATRTVNLIFGKPIPVQMENIPHTVIKQKKGRGAAALIHDS